MRYRYTPIFGDALARLMETGSVTHLRCLSGVPEGARFIEARVDWTRPRHVILIFEHDSFDGLADGDVIPRHPDPVFENV